MPPVVPRAERRVDTRPIPGGRIGVRLPSPPPQRALGEAQRVLEEAGKRALSVYENERKRADNTVIMRESANAAAFENDLLSNPETGLLVLQNEAALDVNGEAQRAWGAYRSEAMGRLSTEAQRLKVGEQLDSRWAGVDRQTKNHAIKERRNFQTTQKNSVIVNEQVAASESYRDPIRVQSSMQTQVETLAEYAADNSLGEDWFKAESQKAVSDTHKGVIGAMLADGDDLAAEDYHKENSKFIFDDEELKGKLGTASRAGEAARKAGEVWDDLGPKTDIAPVNMDKMATAARKAAKGDTKMAKAIITDLKERGNLHNSSAQERTDLNLATVNGARDQGDSLEEIGQMPEFLDLSGTDQLAVRTSIEKTINTTARADKEALKIEQEINRSDLSQNLPLLREVQASGELDQMLREGALSRLGYRSLKVLIDPKRTPTAQTAFKRLDDAKTKRLFDSGETEEDKIENTRRWAEYTQMLHSFIENNPDGDPAEFVDKIMEPVKVDLLDNFFILFQPGIPFRSEEQVIQEKGRELEALAGRKPAAPTPSPPPPATLTPGTVEEGYRFKGGDPSKRQNWEKVR